MRICSIRPIHRTRLPRVALRRFNLKLSWHPCRSRRHHLAPDARSSRDEVDKLTCARSTTRSICRWCRCSPAWNRLASRSTATCSPKCRSGLEREVQRQGPRDLREGGRRIQHQLAQAARRCLFNKLNLPKPMKYGKGKTISTAVDVLEGLAAEHEVPRLVLEYRQLSKLKSTYVDALPALLNPAPGGSTRLQSGRYRRPGDSRRRTRTCRTFRSAPNWAARSVPRSSPNRARSARRRLLADRTAPAGALLAKTRCWSSLPSRRRHPHPHRLAGLRRAAADDRRRASPPRQGRQLRHRLRPLAVRPVAATRHRHQGSQALHRRLLREVHRRARASSTALSNRRAATARSRRSSDVCGLFPISTARIPTCADSPSAPPSTRRCREPPPTSSSWP